jgi:hypothetical protein
MNIQQFVILNAKKLHGGLKNSTLVDGVSIDDLERNSNTFNITLSEDFKLFVDLELDEHQVTCKEGDYWTIISLTKNGNPYFSDSVGYNEYFGYISISNILDEVTRISEFIKQNTI